jgi:hypothetical protein
MPRRFSAPWRVEPIASGFKIVDANGQPVAYVYGHADKREADTAHGLTLHEARRIASNIAKLPACSRGGPKTKRGAMALDWDFALSIVPLLIAFVFAWHYGDAWRYTEDRAMSSIG